MGSDRGAQPCPRRATRGAGWGQEPTSLSHSRPRVAHFIAAHEIGHAVGDPAQHDQQPALLVPRQHPDHALRRDGGVGWAHRRRCRRRLFRLSGGDGAPRRRPRHSARTLHQQRDRTPRDGGQRRRGRIERGTNGRPAERSGGRPGRVRARWTSAGLLHAGTARRPELRRYVGRLGVPGRPGRQLRTIRRDGAAGDGGCDPGRGRHRDHAAAASHRSGDPPSTSASTPASTRPPACCRQSPRRPAPTSAACTSAAAFIPSR